MVAGKAPLLPACTTEKRVLHGGKKWSSRRGKWTPFHRRSHHTSCGGLCSVQLEAWYFVCEILLGCTVSPLRQQRRPAVAVPKPCPNTSSRRVFTSLRPPCEAVAQSGMIGRAASFRSAVAIAATGFAMSKQKQAPVIVVSPGC